MRKINLQRQVEVDIKEKRLRSLMERKGLLGVLLKKQANFSWFTGGGSNMVGIATEIGVTTLLITRDCRYLIANNIEAQRMMAEEGLAELGFTLLEYPWHQDAEATLIKSVCPDLSRVGADMGYHACPLVEEDIKALRCHLTEQEIGRYMYLGEKLARAVEEVMLEVRPGDAECAIGGRIAAKLLPDRIDPTAFIIAADERVYRYRHPIASDNKLQHLLMVSINARYKGLVTTITRMMYLGSPPQALLRQYADNLAIDCRMAATSKPGVPLSAVFKEAQAAYSELGYGDEWKLHHQGGAMGYYARDIKATETTSQIIMENQALCWNPSISGTKIEDGFIATAQGPKYITNPALFPAEEYRIGDTTVRRSGLLIVE